ncbi:MAG: phosphoglucosamine mutase [Rickettsiales bacterium TMED289]|nr:phosphoglucosamine mutase [Gammaproteobacteria bacterium]MAJ89977.1 phosphoglucosamine mutase [Flavobacteriales bacterium]RPF74761.1 MAG: phosphoglucosamine mutase [Rickettsiales bacterium TMED289]|tara:strand:- start:1181 stop:2491 length:1311 start_codon:yes stop_codon:yes gene_type:complete
MKFGTDGFRGRADKSVTPDFCLKLGFHTGTIIKDKGYDSIILGKDTRVSGYMLEAALQAGFISAGVDVKLAGPIPTPAVSFLTATYSGQFGVVISASHNPFYDNGIKFFNKFGRKISKELEEEIEKRLNDPIQPVKASNLGKAFRIDSAAGRYIEYCKSTLKGAHNLKDKTILVDAANGANYKVTPMLLQELGAKVIRVNCDPDGFNINEKSAVLDQDLFKEYAKIHEFDFCVAVDGDGDRLVLSDSKGEVCTGDEIIYTLALRNKKQNKNGSDCVVGTDMTNQGVVDALNDLEIDFHRTQVGDKFVSRELVDKKLNLGGETSGHIIQREFSESGDANIALIQTLAALEELNLSLADIKAKINYKPQTLESFDIKDMQVIETKEFSEQIKSLEKDYSNARISVRKSGTESKIRVMVESDTENDITSVMNSVKSLII